MPEDNKYRNVDLDKGQVIKNYKEMCKILNEPILQGNSKRAQLHEWQRYFEWEQIGQKFIITTIYDEALPQNDKRAYGNNSIYVKYIELLLMKFLSSKNDYTCTFKKADWYRVLGFINNNYVDHFYKEKNYELSNGLITNFDVNDFYRRVPPKLESILFSALRNLKNRCLLDWTEETIVVEPTECEKYYRLANNREVLIILEAKKEVLTSMGLSKMSEVFFKFKTNEFYKNLNALLKERYGWEYTYKQYKIIYSAKYIQEDIPVTTIQIEQMKLNQTVIATVNNQAQKRYDTRLEKYNKAIDEYIENWDGFGDGTHFAKEEVNVFKYNDSYVDAQIELASYFLKI